jgi:hypothetical protein
MADVKEQRICITFCFKLGKITTETHEMLKEAFGDNALGLTQTYEWFKSFKNGRMSVDDAECSGRPSTGTSTENVAEVREAILEDRTRMIHNVCNIVKLSYGTCQRILSSEFNMWHTMTTRPPTHHPLCRSFDFNENDNHPPSSLLTRPRPLFPKMK